MQLRMLVAVVEGAASRERQNGYFERLPPALRKLKVEIETPVFHRVLIREHPLTPAGGGALRAHTDRSR